MSTENTATTDLTGRDNYIIAEALYIAIKHNKALAEGTEYGITRNTEDMELILNVNLEG